MDRLLNVTTGLSVILLVMVLISVRRAHIRVEYSVSWLLAAAAMLILSRAHPLLDAVRNMIGLPDSPLTLFLLAGGVFLFIFFRFSVIPSPLPYHINHHFSLPSAWAPLSTWIGPVRPVLMFSYWVNTRISMEDTSSYPVFNVLIHMLTGILVFLVIRRLLEWAGAEKPSRTPFAAFGAVLFLLHPLPADSVAYISGRSESLCGMFASASYSAFLYRRSPAISWAGVATVVPLFGAALLTKEQAVVLPALFVLTDLCWNPEPPLRPVRPNWKLYVVRTAR